MREIKFKGRVINKRHKELKEWITGSLVHQTDYYGEKVDRYFIIDGTSTQDYDIGFEYEVYKNTVCQCTDKKDKNNKEIWENDIVKYMINDTKYLVGQIVWEESGFKFKYVSEKLRHDPKTRKSHKFYMYMDLSSKFFDFGEAGEVIGNAIDNPKLLEKVEEVCYGITIKRK